MTDQTATVQMNIINKASRDSIHHESGHDTSGTQRFDKPTSIREVASVDVADAGDSMGMFPVCGILGGVLSTKFHRYTKNARTSTARH